MAVDTGICAKSGEPVGRLEKEGACKRVNVRSTPKRGSYRDVCCGHVRSNEDCRRYKTSRSAITVIAIHSPCGELSGIGVLNSARSSNWLDDIVEFLL